MSKKPDAAKRKLNRRMHVKRLEVIRIAMNQKTTEEQLDAMIQASKLSK